MGVSEPHTGLPNRASLRLKHHPTAQVITRTENCSQCQAGAQSVDLEDLHLLGLNDIGELIDYRRPLPGGNWEVINVTASEIVNGAGYRAYYRPTAVEWPQGELRVLAANATGQTKKYSRTGNAWPTEVVPNGAAYAMRELLAPATYNGKLQQFGLNANEELVLYKRSPSNTPGMR